MGANSDWPSADCSFLLLGKPSLGKTNAVWLRETAPILLAESSPLVVKFLWASYYRPRLSSPYKGTSDYHAASWFHLSHTFSACPVIRDLPLRGVILISLVVGEASHACAMSSSSLSRLGFSVLVHRPRNNLEQ